MLHDFNRYLLFASAEQDCVWLLAAIAWLGAALARWKTDRGFLRFALLRSGYLIITGALSAWVPDESATRWLCFVRLWQAMELALLCGMASKRTLYRVIGILGCVAVVCSTGVLGLAGDVGLIALYLLLSVLAFRRQGLDGFARGWFWMLVLIVVILPAADRFGPLEAWAKHSGGWGQRLSWVGLLAAVFSFGAGIIWCWLGWRQRVAASQMRPFVRVWIAVVAVWILVGAGLVFTVEQIARRDYERSLMLRVQTAALRLTGDDIQTVLNPNARIGATRVRPNSMTLKLADYAPALDPAFDRLRQDLIQVKAFSPDASYVYIICHREGRTLIIATADRWAERRGEVTIYAETPSESMIPFRDRREVFFDLPFRDAWGDLVSVNAPLFDQESHKLLGWLAMDFPLATYMEVAAPIRWAVMGVVAFGCAMAGLAFVYFGNRSQSDRLRFAMQQAVEAEQTKTELIATLSHDLRTPLQSMLAYAELLDGTLLDARQRGYVAAQSEQGRGLYRMLQNLLHLGAAQQGLIPKREFISLRRLLGELIDGVRVLALAKNLKLSLSITDDVPDDLLGDEVRLRQILLNLLGNAVKFTMQGEIALAVRRVTELDEAPGETEPVWLTFAVRDTGPGIRPEMQAGMFDLRPGRSAAKGRDGIGLGLPLVGKLSLILGGAAQVFSESGKGTEFIVRLPFGLARDAENRNEGGGLPRISGPRPTRSLQRVLLVEDHEVVRAAVAELVRGLGLTVEVAATAAEALDKWQTGSFDGALIDLGLPDQSGLAVARALRAAGGQTRAWLVALTAAHGDEARGLVEAAGFDCYVLKPADRATLREALTPSDVPVEQPLDFFDSIDVATARREALRAETRKARAEIAVALSSRDAAQTVRAVHHLRNSALMLGDREMAQATRTLEEICRQSVVDWVAADCAHDGLEACPYWHDNEQ